jgi:ABC-2 type transport system permease protein
MQMSFFFLLPNILLLSGFMFPFEGMPGVRAGHLQAIPLTHFLRIIRGIVLRGATLADLLPELAWLGGITLALVLASALRFQKKLG